MCTPLVILIVDGFVATGTTVKGSAKPLYMLREPDITEFDTAFKERGDVLL